MTGSSKVLPTFAMSEGKGKDRFWLINGSPDFAVIPAGTLPGFDVDMPIRLPVGDNKFGAAHILNKHYHWVMKAQPSGCVATLVHRKLSQPGRIFTTDSSDKLALVMRVAPDAFMVLKKIPDFFSITTLYVRPRQTEGVELARYTGHLWATAPYRPTTL
ncbi:hypothetical protein D3C76_555870 [compost metagenome]